MIINVGFFSRDMNTLTVNDFVKCELCVQGENCELKNTGDLYLHLTQTHFKERLLKGVSLHSKTIRFTLIPTKLKFNSRIHFQQLISKSSKYFNAYVDRNQLIWDLMLSFSAVIIQTASSVLKMSLCSSHTWQRCTNQKSSITTTKL